MYKQKKKEEKKKWNCYIKFAFGTKETAIKSSSVRQLVE